MSAEIIEMTVLREAKDAAEATARLHDALRIAAEITAAGALSTEGRLQLLNALLPGFAPGLGWQMNYTGSPLQLPPNQDAAA